MLTATEAFSALARRTRTKEWWKAGSPGTHDTGGFYRDTMNDGFIASEGFGVSLVGSGRSPEKILEALRQWGPKEVILTRGAKGSVGWRGGAILSQEAFSVDAVDTTGAGDVYHGAYIYGLVQGWGICPNACVLPQPSLP